jgi:uncharacterized membrane protein
MTQSLQRVLYWAPRVLSIAFILFLSLFALDVFDEGRGFWPALAALAIHLVPSFVLVLVLLAAWKREWIGAVLFAAAGGLYIYHTLQLRLSATVKWSWCLAIAAPALVIAALFLWNWVRRYRRWAAGA